MGIFRLIHVFLPRVFGSMGVEWWLAQTTSDGPVAAHNSQVMVGGIRGISVFPGVALRWAGRFRKPVLYPLSYEDPLEA